MRMSEHAEPCPERLSPRGLIIDFVNASPKFFDFLNHRAAAYPRLMKTKMELLRQSCLYVGRVEACLAALVLTAAILAQSRSIGWIFWGFTALVILVNFPGFALAHKLNLFLPAGGWLGGPPGLDLFGTENAGFRPVAGWIVIFVVGALCWVVLIWYILSCRATRNEASESGD